MGKSSLVLSVLLLIFASAHAEFHRQEIDPENSPVEDAKILLPIEDSNSDAASVVDIQTQELDLTQYEQESVDGASGRAVKVDSIPLTVVDLRPVHRPFAFPFSLRHRHGCRHHRKGPQILKPWAPRFYQREIRYGDDMILSSQGSKADAGNVDSASGGLAPHIPARWVRIQSEWPVFHGDWKEGKRGRYHRRHHHHDHHEEEREEEEHKRKREAGSKHENGILKSIRKFLKHF